ncbi:ef hand family protein [Stylonychia lemnae]|uniref:Ef hand family protein n=1 Tax=Stylonychia lemnae TaxID=5949 RepID=A0A078B3E9_STYLE|nr:ef hand family protein [Stylonychia lemnae]|eukprot:CDW88969.1 ef hand family protein [Stylonychia lemnae]
MASTSSNFRQSNSLHRQQQLDIISQRSQNFANIDQNEETLKVMKKCTLIKIKVKQLLKQIDVEKADVVNVQVFYDILKLHNVDFKDADKRMIRQRFVQSIKGQEKIKYKEVIANISVNLTTAGDPLQNNWILRNSDSDAASIKRFMDSDYGSIADNMSQISGYSNIMRHFSPIGGLKQSIKFNKTHNNPESPIKKILPSEISRKLSSPGSPIQPVKLQKITDKTATSMLRAIQDAGVDIRKLEVFRNRLFLKTEVPIEEFKSILSFSLNLPPKKSIIVDEFIEAISLIFPETYGQSFFLKQIIDDFFNLCHYWPLQVKRDSNQSHNMYKVMNSAKAQNFETSLEMFKNHRTTINSDIYKLYELIWVKIQEKYDKINHAYKFFAGLSTNKISFNDFVIGLENLRLKLTTKEINDVFNSLDQDKDGYISYLEFCNMAEERRRGIDPFHNDHQQKAQEFFTQVREKKSQSLNPRETVRDTQYFMNHHHIPHLEDDQEGPISLEKDAMLNSFILHKNKKEREMRRKINISQPDCFGKISHVSDNIGDVIAHIYTNWDRENDYGKTTPTKQLMNASRRMNRTIEYESAPSDSPALEKKGNLKKKIFKNFHTKTSQLRDQFVESNGNKKQTIKL